MLTTLERELQKAGFVLPKKNPSDDDKTYGELELRSDWERKRADKAFEILVNLPSVAGGALSPVEDKATRAARKALLMSVVHALLGDDYDIAEYC